MDKGQIRTELNFKRKNSSVFPAECTSKIFRDEAGKIWTVIIIRDMSLAKTAEELLRKAQEESAHFAAHDYLTQTLNRRAFMDQLELELERSKREHSSLSLLLLDIDYFKKINDTLGHACGDAVLKNVAKHLAEKLRAHDILGRYGGDEFIICLPNTTAAEANEIAERLRIHIEDSDMICKKDSIFVTVSIGLAFKTSDSTQDSNALMLRADKNLYTAKLQRNAVCGM